MKSNINSKDGGFKYVHIEFNDYLKKILKGKNPREQAKVIEKYLKEKFSEIKYNNDTYFITSKDASKITNTVHEEKIKAVSQINELLMVSELVKIDEKPNHKIFTIFFYFNTIFEIDNIFYNGELNIGYHKYLKQLQIYDLCKIKKVELLGNGFQPKVASSTSNFIVEENDAVVNDSNKIT